MKRFLLTTISGLMLFTTAFTQANPSFKFSTTGSNVIAYKQGTSCTASAYSFYMINDVGMQAATPFYTISNTSREVNGIGINPADRFLYGVEYDRDGACAFSNFHLKRYDTQGNSDDLGMLSCPAGGSVSGALGCVTSNGNFVYTTKDALGNSYISIIAGIASLPVNASGTLTINTSKQIINNANTFSYADWAVHPTDAKIYTYGIANVGGVSTGKLLVLDPNTGILQAIGLTDATDFLDAARDNFGGVYFGNDGMLYGVNVNTRKLYKIDPLTGSVTFKSTMIGSGQIRADMGSYSTGWIMLPVDFTKVELVTKNSQTYLHWTVANSSQVNEFVIEQATAKDDFKEIKSVTVTDKSQVDFSVPVTATANTEFRVKALTDGKTAYSLIVLYTPPSATAIKLLGNPVQNNQLNFIANLSVNCTYSIININGSLLKSGTLTSTKNAVNTIDLPRVSSGVYILRLSGDKAENIKFIVD